MSNNVSLRPPPNQQYLTPKRSSGPPPEVYCMWLYSTSAIRVVSAIVRVVSVPLPTSVFSSVRKNGCLKTVVVQFMESQRLCFLLVSVRWVVYACMTSSSWLLNIVRAWEVLRVCC
ncbi:hypothetical protein CRM22_008861 [Opisthorchis felineus]|uniref:Uncharacterized protein n=1 Tax=Opisthorchis felineus TaxID=147828 RepID=A0A4S2LA06_OPIFE|nr:hypothetical protein CRM22_008861 [Opisthorchis felineus]